MVGLSSCQEQCSPSSLSCWKWNHHLRERRSYFHHHDYDDYDDDDQDLVMTHLRFEQ